MLLEISYRISKVSSHSSKNKEGFQISNYIWHWFYLYIGFIGLFLVIRYTKFMKRGFLWREGLFVLTFLVIVGTSFFVWQVNKKEDVYRPGLNAIHDKAVTTAQMVLQQQKKMKVDLSSGPCLSNDLLEDWAADIVHNPRTPEDDLIDNQCASLLDGTAMHIVELDLDGNVIRIK